MKHGEDEEECNEESRVREGGDRAFRRASKRRGDEAEEGETVPE